MTTVRVLEPCDSIDYRAIRLEALKTYPNYFGSSYNQQVKQRKLYFERLIENGSEKGKMVGAFLDDQLVGICGVTFETDVLPGAGEIIQMYVKAEHQNLGLGKSLIQEIIGICIANRVSTIILAVNKENTNAISVYEKSGFEVNDSLNSDPALIYMMLKLIP